MKKLLSILVLSVFIFSLVGCNTSSNKKTSNTAEFQTVTKGKLTMATNAAFPPYEFHEGDKIVGIDAEIAGLIAEKLGLELVIEDVEFTSIIPGIQAGKYDIGMAGMTVTEERLRDVAFSDSYAKGVQSVIVKENSEIKSISDIVGHRVGVQESTTGDIYASSPVDEGGFGEENVVRYPNGAVAIEALKAGKIDCIILDNQPAKSFVAANTGLKVLDTEYTSEDYAISFDKENTALQTKVNEVLKELIADGSVQKIIDKYITAD